LKALERKRAEQRALASQIALETFEHGSKAARLEPCATSAGGGCGSTLNLIEPAALLFCV